VRLLLLCCAWNLPTLALPSTNLVIVTSITAIDLITLITLIGIEVVRVPT